MIGRIRRQLAISAALFVGAAAFHTGLLVSGYEHSRAATAELVIGLVLVAGLGFGLMRPASAIVGALAVEAFAVLGTFVGLFTIAVGIGPRTMPDVALHVVMLAVLGWGLVTAWAAHRSRKRLVSSSVSERGRT